jgi:predicted unusual protein kinase regulating ubiquinone biosynthesis (AarF/ABC1/UbiB family)
MSYVKKLIQFIIFLSSTCWILLSELFIYGLFKNYDLMVDNLTYRLAKINILYVKVFQAFALNNNLINDNMNNKLLKFTDNAPWDSSDIDYYNLIAFSNDYNLSLKNGFEYPINSGMISLIFKAYDRTNNKNVIIKIKRVNIEKRLSDAVDNLLYLIHILSFIPMFQKYHISDSIHKSIHMITEQTDFKNEVKNMQKIKKNCIHLKYVIIPHVYDFATNKYPNIIMMEFLEGITINKIDKNDYEEFAKQVIKFGFVTTAIHGFTHGDLHGGNILFIKDEKDTNYKYKIGILDFGIVYKIDNAYKNILFEIAIDFFTLPSKILAEKIIMSGIIEPIDVLKNLPENHFSNIVQFIKEIIDDFISSSKNVNQMQIYRFLSNFHSYLINNKISELGLRPSDNFVKTQMCLTMNHGVTLTLCNGEYISISDKVLNELFHLDLFT